MLTSSRVAWLCRGGPLSTDHLDILSIVDVHMCYGLQFAIGHGHELQDRIVSNIIEIGDRLSPAAE